MQKIFNYIIKGQGLGIKFILLASFIISLVFSLFIRINGADLVPYANDIINQMLPLKIENGVVVEPQNTIRVAHLNSGEVSIPLPIVMDTTVDTINTQQVEKGFYLTRRNFYVINDNESRIYPLEEDVELLPDDYTDDIKSALTWTAVSLFFLGIIFIFIAYFIATIFYALCAQLIGLIFKKKYKFDARMRLSVLCFLAVYILYYILGLCGIENNRLIFFVTVLILQSAIIFKLPEIKEEIAMEDNSWLEEGIEIKAEEKSVETAPIPEVKATKKTGVKKAPTKTPKTGTEKKKTVKKKTPAKKKAEK